MKGADTDWQSFVRTIPSPTGLASDIATTATGTTRVLTSWNPRLGAKQYKVEFSTTNSFATPFETATIQNAAFAPTMYSAAQYGNGGTIYWRVAAIDADGNVGAWATSTLTLPAKMVLTSIDHDRPQGRHQHPHHHRQERLRRAGGGRGGEGQRRRHHGVHEDHRHRPARSPSRSSRRRSAS